MKHNQNRLASAGQALLKDIPTKATGDLGAQFFQEQPHVSQSLRLLKKKQRHQELREKGYLINEKPPKNELDMDIPFYEVFDPPNLNYRKVFHPENLEAMVAYNYHSPDFAQNEIFLVSKEDQEMADRLINLAQENARRKEAVLHKLNDNKRREREIEQLQKKREQQNQVIEKIQKDQSSKRSPKKVTFVDEDDAQLRQLRIRKKF